MSTLVVPPDQECAFKSEFLKRSPSQVFNLRLQALKNRIQRTPSIQGSRSDCQEKASMRPRSSTLAGQVATKIRNVFLPNASLTVRNPPEENDYCSHEVKKPERAPATKSDRPRREATISFRSVSYRRQTPVLETINFTAKPKVRTLRKSFKDKYLCGLNIRKRRRPPTPPPAPRRVRKAPAAQDPVSSGPEAKFKVVSKKTYESKVYPKEMYVVIPAKKQGPRTKRIDPKKRLRFKIMPDNVESGGPEWNSKVRELLYTDPGEEAKSIEEPLYNYFQTITTLTACTSAGSALEAHLSPPTSLPLLRRSIDSAYSDEFSPFTPSDESNMIFTNKKSTSSADSSPQTPFSPHKSSRASTSSSSMSSMDVEPARQGSDGSMVLPPDPRKKERSVKKQNLGNSIKNFIKPTIDQRTQQFHKIFKGLITNEENFVASFSCAFQREILAQGRLFISDRHIAFAANIFGWETKFVIRFADIVSIRRAKTAKIFANSIEIETSDHHKHFFASFTNREKSYVLMYRLWQMIVTDVPVNPLTCKDVDKLLPPVNEMDSSHHDDDEGGAKTLELERTTAMLFAPPTPSEPSTPDISLPDAEFPTSALDDNDEISDVGECEETKCECKHEGKLYLDNVYDFSVEKMKEIMSGPTPWFHVYAAHLKGNPVHGKIIDNITEFKQTPWKDEVENGEKKLTSRASYQMTVNHSMLQKTITVNESLEYSTMFGKLALGFKINKETRNSGVPYADYFTVRTSYCVTRISKNQCRLKVHGLLNFIKTPWGPIKGYMEKSTDAGLAERYRALDYCLIEDLKNSAVASMSSSRDIVPEPEVASSDDEGADLEDKRDRTLTAQMAQEGAELIQAETKKHSIRRDISTFSTNTIVPSARAAIVPESNLHCSLEFYIQIIIVLLSTIVLLLLLQWWSTPTHTQCSYNAELLQLAAQLKNPEFAEILQQKQTQEVRRSVGHLSEQLVELMSLMRVRDET